jgi:hypothetical protein
MVSSYYSWLSLPNPKVPMQLPSQIGQSFPLPVQALIRLYQFRSERRSCS